MKFICRIHTPKLICNVFQLTIYSLALTTTHAGEKERKRERKEREKDREGR